MPAETAYTQFLGVLRQVLALRKSGGSPAAVEAIVEEAWELWADVPPPTTGDQRVWPPDVAAIADELGFNAAAALSPIEDEASAGVSMTGADAMRLETLANAIDQAIAEAGGIGNVEVACSADQIVITGIAADDESHDQALIIAAKLAPGVRIVDGITDA